MTSKRQNRLTSSDLETSNAELEEGVDSVDPARNVDRRARLVDDDKLLVSRSIREGENEVVLLARKRNVGAVEALALPLLVLASKDDDHLSVLGRLDRFGGVRRRIGAISDLEADLKAVGCRLASADGGRRSLDDDAKGYADLSRAEREHLVVLVAMEDELLGGDEGRSVVESLLLVADGDGAGRGRGEGDEEGGFRLGDDLHGKSVAPFGRETRDGLLEDVEESRVELDGRVSRLVRVEVLEFDGRSE